jgi:hypothetical protein
MSRSFLLFVLALSFSSSAFAQAPTSTATMSSPTQVVYEIGSSTITTYDVDPQTLTATQAGEPLTVTAADLNYSTLSVTPSANDHAIYVIGSASQTSQQYLTVYTTSTSGLPQSPSLQAIPTTGLVQVQTNPKATFLYAVFQSSNGNNTFVSIRGYQVDAEGKLSDAQAVAHYKLPNGGDEFCSVSILGFNAAGSELYDDVACSDPGAYYSTYNERSVDLQTGEIGPDVEVYSWSSISGGYQSVQFVGNYVFDFETPNNYQTGLNSVNIFPLVADTTTPLVQCTASMLESCGYAMGVAHPSGKYIFMGVAEDFCEIDRVELKAKKIVDTGNYIPSGFGGTPSYSQFSPDGTIAYTYSSNDSIQLYGFNVETSEVTPGGSFPLASSDFIIATARK